MPYQNEWIARGLLTSIDRRFADLIVRLSGAGGPELWLGAALASNAVQKGHVCLDLKSASCKSLFADEPAGEDTPACPPWEDWRDGLKDANAVGAPGDFKPLILDEAGRLYLYRYWRYERMLAHFFQMRALTPADPVDLQLLRRGLDRFFPCDEAGGPNYQRIAAFTAVCRRLAVITGGPGTGKTSTVVKILALLLEQAKGIRHRIALAAPTGKAASRLCESVRKTKQEMDCPPEIRALIPEEASTLHRLLGSIPHSTHFRFDAKNPLRCDTVAVDEASMIDLPLMAKLVEALPERCRLILLGDRDQLASVQPGAVFGDICGAGTPHTYSGEHCRFIGQEAGEPPAGEAAPAGGAGLRDSIVTLQESYRFGAWSGIGTVSRLVNGGSGEAAMEAAAGGRYDDIAWRDLPAPGRLERALEEVILEGYGPYLKAVAPEETFEAFGRFRVLCALRQGPYGAAAVNQAVTNILDRAGLIHAAERWFHGRPILVTRNDYQLRLFNGDIGIVLLDKIESGDRLVKRVFFHSERGLSRKILPMRLPEHETAYAMTVHKSQGSEFDRVVLILPPKLAPVLTRELIYTGITRAMHRVEIWGSKPVFLEAARRRIGRTSGLRDSLWRPC